MRIKSIYHLPLCCLLLAIFADIATINAASCPDEETGQWLPNVEVTPPGPEATAFQQYGNIEALNSTGKPNISIPLHQITGQSLPATRF